VRGCARPLTCLLTSHLKPLTSHPSPSHASSTATRSRLRVIQHRHLHRLAWSPEIEPQRERDRIADGRAGAAGPRASDGSRRHEVDRGRGGDDERAAAAFMPPPAVEYDRVGRVERAPMNVRGVAPVPDHQEGEASDSEAARASRRGSRRERRRPRAARARDGRQQRPVCEEDKAGSRASWRTLW